MREKDESGRVRSSSKPQLYVRMLGPPIIEWVDRSFDIPRRQVRAVLYRLAMQLAPVPREHLCGLFWPDIPEWAARRHLSHVLAHLHCLLPNPEILHATTDHITLDPQRTWSDTAVFDQLCVALRSSQRCLTTLARAVDLYRGPLLAGFSLSTSHEFETWVEIERSDREHCCLEALAALVDEHSARGNYHAAIDYARRYVAVDEVAEEMHCRLIALYGAVHDPGAASRQFEHCALALERELGSSPQPETRAAYQKALTGRFAFSL